MNRPNNTDDLEPFADAVRRHRHHLKDVLKKKTALKVISRFMARADAERGLVAYPENS